MSTSSVDKKGRNKKISEQAMLDYLREGANYPPVQLRVVSELSGSTCSQRGPAPGARYDALVELAWRDQTHTHRRDKRGQSEAAAV